MDLNSKQKQIYQNISIEFIWAVDCWKEMLEIGNSVLKNFFKANCLNNDLPAFRCEGEMK